MRAEAEKKVDAIIAGALANMVRKEKEKEWNLAVEANVEVTDRVAAEAVADFGIDATFEDREAAFYVTLVQADVCLAAFDAGKSVAEIETTEEAEAKDMRRSVEAEEAMKKSAAEGGRSGEGCRRGCGCEGARRGCGDGEEGRRGGGCDEETCCRGGGGEGVHRGGGGAPEDYRGHEARGV